VGHLYQVGCPECGVRGAKERNRAKAYTAWNTRPEAQSLPTVSGDEIIVGLNDLKFTLERIAEKTPDEQPHYPGGSRPFGTGDLRHLIGVLDAASKRLAALSPTVSEADELVERTDSSLVADMLTAAAHQPHTRAFTNAEIVEAFAALETAALRTQPSKQGDGS
jgi:hypothetical protein